ncbi:MAG: stage III sporulation protein AB [Oscillospiraceae bacterium]|nr:stage III sporulation protein AB [Oscillospiraceae bacterium]
MIRWIGAAMIVFGAGSFGIAKTAQFYRQQRQLRSFLNMLELLKCELNYTLFPLPKLCRITAERSDRICASFLNDYAAMLDGGACRSTAAREAFAKLNSALPPDAAMAILELFGSLGRYDIDGEDNLLRLTQHRLKTALERGETEKRPMAKGYALLGLCTGAAIAILLV